MRAIYARGLVEYIFPHTRVRRKGARWWKEGRPGLEGRKDKRSVGWGVDTRSCPDGRFSDGMVGKGGWGLERVAWRDGSRLGKKREIL